MPSAIVLPTKPVLTLAFVVAVVAALGACVDTPDPAHLRVVAGWKFNPEMQHTHLELDVWNDGGTSTTIGPGGDPVRVSGPDELIPIDWTGATGRTLPPGDAVSVTFHSSTNHEGHCILILDHARGEHAAPPNGHYEVCVDGSCSETEYP